MADQALKPQCFHCWNEIHSSDDVVKVTFQKGDGKPYECTFCTWEHFVLFVVSTKKPPKTNS